MRNIFLVVQNNFNRLLKDKLLLFMMIIMLPVIVYLGIFFSKTEFLKGKLAIVGATPQQETSFKTALGDNSKITLEFLDEKPSNTDLIKGIYLAEINFTGNTPEVISFGREEIKKSLEANLKGETYNEKIITTTMEGKIIGFLLMYSLFGSLMVLDLFLTDRETGVYVRVLNGTLSYFQYIAGQILYSILTLTMPIILLSLLVIKILNIDLTISLSLFTILLLLVGFLSSSFSMLISSICKGKNSVSIGGSTIVMITSLLGGCLVNIQDNNKIIGYIRDVIPQKRLIDLANSFDYNDLIFLVGTIVVFILVSVFLGKRQYENGDFI